MERWHNKVAVVTGASSGIGAAIVQSLLNSGLCVVGLARRLESMEKIKTVLPKELQEKFTPIKCNVGDVHSVNEAFDEIEREYKGVDILVNSAGTINPTSLLTGDVSSIQEILQTNVMGVVHCNQRAYKSMKKRNFDGHVIILNSIVGHNLSIFPKEMLPVLGMYTASKWAVTALTEMYRQEFRHFDTKIKITSISPGIVDTALIDGLVRSCSEGNCLNVNDVAASVLYALGTAPHVQIHELKIKPVAESVV
ncbi:farnesol dehydrogenase [Stomoxys calcitrans]|uniref:farnesol dehydrogenase n=1 Tax=Stomoxys calcitrans TaxID=35570 RepID=UPI0027E30485|nr:farnesol dehydrogenase [Stomoxys calcitrans]